MYVFAKYIIKLKLTTKVGDFTKRIWPNKTNCEFGMLLASKAIGSEEFTLIPN